MDNHIYMVYDDSSPESTRDADITHKRLLDQGFRVINKDVGYTTSRYEYARVVVNSQIKYNLISLRSQAMTGISRFV